MNLNAMQKKIVGYIDGNFDKYLSQYGIKKPTVSTEFMDLDKFRGDFTLFVDFNRITFAKGKFADDCGGAMQLSVSFFLVYRNATTEKLRETMLDGAGAFYALMGECNVAGDVVVNELNNYNIVEGTKFIVISEFQITFETEVSG